MASGSPIRALGREWRVILAALSLLSLVLLAAVFPTAGRLRAREESRLAAVRRHLDAREYDPAEARLRDFFAESPSSPRIPEAEYLLGRVYLGRAVDDPEDPPPHLPEAAWRQFRAAALHGYDARACGDACVETAALLRDLGRYGEACDKYRVLLEEPGRRELHLDYASTLAGQAALEPARIAELAAEAERRIDAFLQSASGPDRARGLRARSRIQWRLRRFDDSVKTAELGLRDHPDLQAEFRLERGRALARLGQTDRALEDLEFALKNAATAPDKDEAAYFVAEQRLRALDRRGLVPAQEVADGRSRLAPFAELLLGLYQMEVRQQDPYGFTARGLARIRRVLPGEIPLFEFDAFHLRLKTAAAREQDSEAVRGLARTMDQLFRLHPDNVGIAFDAADLRYRHGLRLSARSETSAKTDPKEAAISAREGFGFLREAALAYDRIAAHGASRPPDVSRARLSGAEAYRAARMHLHAALRYRSHYDLDPKLNIDSLYFQGVSLMDAGLYESARPGEPSALAVFTEYLREARTEGRAPEILLHRARILLRLGRTRDAADELESLLRDPEHGRDPRQPIWASALFLRAQALLETARRTDPSTPESQERRRRTFEGARVLFEEYLERYSVALPENVTPPPQALEAAFSLARIAVESRVWLRASGWIERMLLLAARIPPAGREEQAANLRQASFLLGDLYYNQERYDDALAAWENASRRYPAGDERLGAMLGRVRALHRLGRRSEAKQLYEDAQAVWEIGREQFDASLDGRGREYWPVRIREVGEEIR